MTLEPFARNPDDGRLGRRCGWCLAFQLERELPSPLAEIASDAAAVFGESSGELRIAGDARHCERDRGSVHLHRVQLESAEILDGDVDCALP